MEFFQKCYSSGDKMKASRFIKTKQKNHALNNSIKLRSKKKDKGASLYCETINENLFIPLPVEVIEDFHEGDGNELRISYLGDLAKIQALHSSSAIVVNFFTYWLKDPIPLAVALKLVSPKNQCNLSMEFEAKVPIDDSFHRHPNLDVLFRVEGKSRFLAYAVESKLSEPFNSRRHKGLNPVYLTNEFWTGLPKLQELAGRLSPDDREFRHLDVPQLLKHILGLSRAFKRRFKLLYLYWDGLGEEGASHQAEIAKFRQVAKLDKIEFRAISFQDLVERLATRHRVKHEKYINYISTRYL